MDCEFVAAFAAQRGQEWYGQLLKQCGWNARYWEQRALFANKQLLDSEAYSYARRAVEIRPGDPFSQNTLGKVCIDFCCRRIDDFGIERFWEGVTALENSRIAAYESGTEWEHPYVTFFSGAVRLISLSPHYRPQVASTFDQWMRNARRSDVYSRDTNGKTELDRFQHQWLSISAKAT
jgi:hypothetical protein